MTDEQIKAYEHVMVRATLQDGAELIGRLDVTPEKGLYHIMPDPKRPNSVEGGFLADIYTADFAKIERL
jgi:hypothetical protein